MANPFETWSFATARIGRRVLVYDQLASTNTTAVDLIRQGEADGLVVVARDQTAGRGQFGRTWHSRPGSSLLMSVVVNPPQHLLKPAILTGFAAVAVGDAILSLTGIQTRIKWPNDLLLRGKKVCGILIEQHGPSAIVGIGLNLNQTAEEFVSAGLPEAASLATATGAAFDLRTATAAVLQRLDQEYDRLLRGEYTAVEADWKWRIGLLGRNVRIERMDSTTISGRLLEMEFEQLALELADGTVEAILPETVRHIVER